MITNNGAIPKIACLAVQFRAGLKASDVKDLELPWINCVLLARAVEACCVCWLDGRYRRIGSSHGIASSVVSTSYKLII
jgi:hypothetical protein